MPLRFLQACFDAKSSIAFDDRAATTAASNDAAAIASETEKAR